LAPTPTPSTPCDGDDLHGLIIFRTTVWSPYGDDGNQTQFTSDVPDMLPSEGGRALVETTALDTTDMRPKAAM
jgi:hypothetical protein